MPDLSFTYANLSIGDTIRTDTPPPGVKRFELYGGAVIMDFNPKATKYRYTVTDAGRSRVNDPVRGVTSVIGDIIDKPDLKTWPLNMANGALFGAQYKEQTGEYEHDWEKALIKPGVDYDDETLHEIMLEGSRQWTLRSDKGKDVGTIAHSAIEKYLSGRMEGVVEIPVDLAFEQVITEAVEDVEAADLDDFIENQKLALNSYCAFVEWWESLEETEVFKTETPIYSRSMNYAGTFDLFCKINGKTYILDIKTSNASKRFPLGIYPENLVQLGGYSYALREEYQIEVDDVGIIRVGKDGKLYIATAKDLGVTRDDCERAFAFAVRLHDWLAEVKPFLADRYMTSHLNPSQRVETETVTNQEEAANA